MTRIKLIIDKMPLPTKDNKHRNKYDILPGTHFRNRENKRNLRTRIITINEEFD